MARVAIMGWSLNLEIIMPLNVPHAAPITSAAMMPTIAGIPASTISLPITMPVKATTEPTEISMPPVKITTFTPSASTAYTVTCCKMLIRLPTDRNAGSAMESTTHSTTSTMTADILERSIFLSFSFMSFPLPYKCVFAPVAQPTISSSVNSFGSSIRPVISPSCIT